MFTHSFAVAVTIAVAYVRAQIPSDCTRMYVVAPGDTCNTIAVENSVSDYQIRCANAGRIDAACDNLQVGEMVCLALAGQDCESVHVIHAGDSCGVIAQNAGISLATLLANNPNVNKDCSNILIGEVLCTANKIIF